MQTLSPGLETLDNPLLNRKAPLVRNFFDVRTKISVW
jgi:hypothetical protein